MPTGFSTPVAAAITALALVGCVSDRAEETFGRVRARVAEREDQRILWHRDKEDLGSAQDRVDELLRDDLRMEEALEIAILANPRLQATYESIGLAEARVVEALLPPNPSFETVYKDVRNNGHIWEFIAVQEVVGLILAPWRKQAAEAEAERVQAKVTATVLDTLLDVKLAYRRTQAAEQSLRMMETTLASDQAACDMAKRMRKAGNISKLELKGRRAVLQQTKLAFSQAKLERAERREALNRLLGLTGERIDWQTASTLPGIPAEVFPVKAMVEEAVNNSLDLAMARSAMARSLEEAGITDVTSVLPELHVGVESEREPDGTWVVGPLVEFAVPLFDWGQAERASADARVRRSAAIYREAVLALESGIRITRERLNTARKQAARYQHELMPLQKQLTEETQLHFNAMQLGVFQLLAAKKEELRVRRGYINALRNYWMARAEAEHLMNGRLLRESTVDRGSSMPAGGMEGGAAH